MKTSFFDINDVQSIKDSLEPETKLIFIESIGNPTGSIPDIEVIAEIAHQHGIPLVVDNTFPSPYLLNPIKFGADIVIHSATKFIGGHGTSIGGVIVESGQFDWTQNNKFPLLSEPDDSYHGLILLKQYLMQPSRLKSERAFCVIRGQLFLRSMHSYYCKAWSLYMFE